MGGGGDVQDASGQQVAPDEASEGSSQCDPGAVSALFWPYFCCAFWPPWCQDILAGLESELPDIMCNMLGAQIGLSSLRSNISFSTFSIERVLFQEKSTAGRCSELDMDDSVP